VSRGWTAGARGIRVKIESKSVVPRRLLRTVAACALLACVGTSNITAAFGPTRTISLYNIHTKETVTVTFKKDGQFIPAALEKVNWAMRDWRKDEPTKMDPELIDLLWEVHTELGSKEPIHVISGFRSRGTNDMLRKTVGGQASESRHILGKAADVHFPDVPLKNIRYSALIRERGGVGYYPTSAIPFVHLDTDRVRHWPRLPRYELALLFPGGKSQHQPADGGPITREDVQVAQARHQDVAVQIAAFQDIRRGARAPTVALADASKTLPTPGKPATGLQQVAALVPPAAPVLLEAPRLIDKPSQLTRPSNADRAKLAELAGLAATAPTPIPPAKMVQASLGPTLVLPPTPALRRKPEATALPSLSGTTIPPVAAALREAPQVAAIDPNALVESSASLTDAARMGWGNGFVQAPAFDEEHPEELSYRPFPIAPLMTQTASADDPALVRLVHPDVAKTLELIDQAGGMPPMRLRPTMQTAEIMWAQQFKGEAVNLSGMTDAPSPASAAVPNRKVAVTGK
jgi:uncharacterized protein YcbK (DUF882 family)